jgi:mannose-6-phosphate isomerase-like protein (cupin superfamily)
VSVSDASGHGLQGVTITVTGPVPRSGKTAANGSVHFAGLKAGDYRIRFEHDGFFTLERDVTIKGGLPLEVDASLTEAPPPPEPPPAPAPVAPTNTAPPGEAANLLLVDYIERNPVKEDQLGCTASARTTLLQLKDPLPEQSRADADEVLYVVAGEGTLRLGGKDLPLRSSSLVIVPRGTTRAVTRKGRNPMYLLSIVSGAPCTK